MENYQIQPHRHQRSVSALADASKFHSLKKQKASTKETIKLIMERTQTIAAAHKTTKKSNNPLFVCFFLFYHKLDIAAQIESVKVVWVC